MRNLTEEELNERIAILKRFRTLLEQQRAKFQEYLIVLERQHTEIEMDDADAMAAHTELENQIVANIQNLQKVIVPMKALYESTVGDKPNSSISRIQDDLDGLERKVLMQNERNRTLLQARMAQLRSQMSAFANSNPYRGRRSVYAQRQSGSVVSLEG